jgi:hypothetical protein
LFVFIFIFIFIWVCFLCLVSFSRIIALDDAEMMETAVALGESVLVGALRAYRDGRPSAKKTIKVEALLSALLEPTFWPAVKDIIDVTTPLRRFHAQLSQVRCRFAQKCFHLGGFFFRSSSCFFFSPGAVSYDWNCAANSVCYLHYTYCCR